MIVKPDRSIWSLLYDVGVILYLNTKPYVRFAWDIKWLLVVVAFFGWLIFADGATHTFLAFMENHIGKVIIAVFTWAVVTGHNQQMHMHMGCRKFLWFWNRNHVQPSGYYSNTPGYGDLSNASVDGTGRKHGNVYVTCARCEEPFRLVSVHAHKE